MKWFKKQMLGVDLGTRTVKGVKLKQNKDGQVSLAGHFFQDLSLTTEAFPVGANRDEALKAAIEIQRLSSSEASTAIKDNNVISLALSLPPMSDKEMAQAVATEVAEQVNISTEDFSCDFLPSDTPSDNPDLVTVKAYCVKKDLILEHMKVLKDAGLKCTAIESEMLAITAMLDFNGYIDRNEVAVVFDLGESHITSGLIADGGLSLTRSHEVSTGAINQQLNDRFSLSYEEAEKLKLAFNYLAPEESASETNKVLDEVMTQIFKSLKESLEFYKECRESYGRVDRILLVGGGSQMKSISEVIEKFFQTPAVVVNPFRNIDIFSTSDGQAHDEIAGLAPYMATAVGLALASITLEGKAA